MKVICAWCLQEGLPAFLRETEPLDDPTETHGICGRHRFELLQELAAAESTSAADRRGGPRRGRAESADVDAFLVQWLADGGEVLERLLPGLVAEHTSLARRAETAEQTNRLLEARVAEQRRDLAALQRERQTLTTIHAQLGELVERLLGRLSTDVVEPLSRLRGLGSRPLPPRFNPSS
jgi:hypothetical protein